MVQIRKVFSKNLQRLRKQKKFTQEDLAEKLGISVRYIQRLEGSSCPNVKLDTVALLAKALGTKPQSFFED